MPKSRRGSLQGAAAAVAATPMANAQQSGGPPGGVAPVPSAGQVEAEKVAARGVDRGHIGATRTDPNIDYSKLAPQPR